MATGDDYRIKAAEMRARARADKDPGRQAEFIALARGYLRLARLADRNQENDLVYETPPHHDGDDSLTPPKNGPGGVSA